MLELFGVKYNYFYAPYHAGALLAEGILSELETYNGTSQKWFEDEYSSWFSGREGFLAPLLENGSGGYKEDVNIYLAMGRELRKFSPSIAAEKIAKWEDFPDLAAIINGVFCHKTPSIAHLTLKETGVADIPLCNLPRLGCSYLGESINGNGQRACNLAMDLEWKRAHRRRTTGQIAVNQNT